MKCIRQPTQQVSCLHCGLPVPSLVDSAREPSNFCCHGCEVAHGLIAGEGLDQYYELRRRFAPSVNQPVDPLLSAVEFVDLDAPRFWQHHVQRSSDDRAGATLRLQGIHCAACVWLLERLPQFQPGVLDARVNLPRAQIELQWNPQQVQLSTIAKQLARLGYRAIPMTSSNKELQERLAVRQQLIQIGIAGACSGNIMLLAIAIYFGQWTGMAADHLQLLRVASTAVGLVSLLGPGSLFFRGAIAAVRTGVPHMDLPVSLGLGVGAFSGIWNTLMGSGELYFDSLSMLVFFLLIGRALQAWQQRSACQSVDLLQQLTPATANRVRDGRVEPVAIDDIQAGDTLEIHPGQIVPVDGLVVMGHSDIDSSLLTGESLPVSIEVGSTVIAGTLNLSRTLRVRAEKVGGKTRLGNLLSAIERAGIQKTPIVQWADRISGIFVCVVLGLACAVGVFWWCVHPEVWADRVVAVLIVACPCALGLATPLAIAVGLGRAARSGILIKGGEALQRLSKPGILILDKTGTLTEGRMSVQAWQGPLSALSAAAAAEQANPHPVAAALRDYATKESSYGPMEAADIESHLGSGVSACVAGQNVVVGNRKLLVERGYTISPAIDAQLQAIVDRGQSPLLVGIDGTILAMAAVGDTLRAEAGSVVRNLQARGWRAHILSGDHVQVVKQIGRTLGLKEDQCEGGVSPEGKLQAVRRFQASSKPVIMVGDGVNDAAALAAADIGIAVRGGAEASLQTADIFLANGSLEGIEDIISASQRTMRVIRRNSVASLIYNIASVSLAAAGLLHPVVAALLMPLSGLTVVAVTLAGYAGSGKRKQGAQR